MAGRQVIQSAFGPILPRGHEQVPHVLHVGLGFFKSHSVGRLHERHQVPVLGLWCIKTSLLRMLLEFSEL